MWANKLTKEEILCRVINTWNRRDVDMLLRKLQTMEPFFTKEQFQQYLDTLPLVTGTSLPNVLAVDAGGMALVKTPNGLQIQHIDPIISEYL